MALTSSKLLAQIDLKGSLPDGRFEPEELLDLAYDALIAEVQPLVIGVREEYYVERERQAIIANKKYYRIPNRAVADQLREVKIVRGQQVVNLPQIDLSDVTSEATGTPSGFYLESNYVVLHPTPASTQDSIELVYFLRCAKPVSALEVGVITAIDTATGIVTASCPADWTTADSFDLTSRQNSGESLARDLVATYVSTASMTFAAADLPSELSVGDYISRTGESFIVQVMEEAGPLLAMLTVCEAYHSMGSLQELQAAEAKAEKLKAALIRLIAARVIGEPRRFSPQV